jgi:O-acetyl-ADP-ribose deacetylase (regulator of RNase III)
MLIYHRTSIFESPAQTVVNTVNCVGVMGKGIAADFRKRYPDMYDEYRNICARKLLEPGKLWLWKAPDRWVLNFPTKRHWRNPSRLEWIEAGLQKFVAEYDRRGITEISFPRLGCGNGGLDWDVVRPMMDAHLSELPITVYVHDYEVNIGSPEHLETPSRPTTSRIDRSFDEFIATLYDTVALRDGQFRMLQSGKAFNVRSVPDNQLRFESDDGIAEIDVDDLRSIWVKLLKGVVTARVAQWGRPEVTGEHILSVLSALQDVRTVEIQRRSAEQPELAVEMRRRSGTQLTGDIDPMQPQRAWA